MGHTYRTARPKEASNLGVYNDRRITYIGSHVVQYDSPMLGYRRLRYMEREKFEKWAARDVTAETPKGGWAPIPEND